MRIDTGRNIILCGFMGSGKTTMGKLLARQLNMEFVDMDEYIERQEGKRIPDIFASGGEAVFREAEHRAAKALSGGKGMVLATGGGCMTYDRNVRALAESGTVVFLNPGFDACYSHIRNSDRPLVQSKTERELQVLHDFRKALYRKAAHREVTAAEDLEQRLREILLALAEKEAAAGTLRDYEEADQQEVIALWLRSTTKGHPFIAPSHWEQSVWRLEQEYLPKAKTRLLEDGAGNLLGFLSVLEENFIGALFADPDAQVQGIGSMLVADAKKAYKSLDLAVYLDNGQAVAFYKKHGFQVIDQALDEETQQMQLIMHWESAYETKKDDT